MTIPSNKFMKNYQINKRYKKLYPNKKEHKLQQENVNKFKTKIYLWELKRRM